MRLKSTHPKNIIYRERTDYIVNFFTVTCLEQLIENDNISKAKVIEIAHSLLKEGILSAYKFKEENGMLYLSYRIYVENVFEVVFDDIIQKSIEINLGKEFVRSYYLKMLIS